MFYRLRNRTIDNSHFIETDANWLKTYGNVKRSKSMIAGTIRSTFSRMFGKTASVKKSVTGSSKERTGRGRETNERRFRLVPFFSPVARSRGQAERAVPFPFANVHWPRSNKRAYASLPSLWSIPYPSLASLLPRETDVPTRSVNFN